MLRVGAGAAPLAVRWASLRRLTTLEDQTDRFHRQHAPMPHWYLSQIGVEPALQGHGYGGKLLMPLLARMDAEHMPCYLDTAREGTIALYQRFGFVVSAERELDAGVRVWAMLRVPRG